MMIFDISHLADKSTGTKISYSFQKPVDFPDLKISSQLEFELEIMRLDDALNVRIINLNVTIDTKCIYCLKALKQKIHIPTIEREFYFQIPADADDPNDYFLVNSKDLTIDIAEFVRQEIILHFLSFSVCSSSCKGICAFCGQDKNKKACRCQPELPVENKPLSALKHLASAQHKPSIYNRNNHGKTFGT